MSIKRQSLHIAIRIGLICLTAAAPCVLAGELEPPGPPAPTMKPLDLVEPRAAIRAADLPLVIDAPGSYYLAEDIQTSGGGITVSADRVTIDLMGFTLAGGTGDGIVASCCARASLVVRNGTIAGWSEDGIDFNYTVGARVVDVEVNGNAGRGLVMGSRGELTGCSALGNGSHGFEIYGTVARDSSADDNAGSGFYGGTGSVIASCRSVFNRGDGFELQSSVLESSLARDNDGDGFDVAYGAVVSACMARDNDGIGIRAASGSRVEGSTASTSGLDGIAVLYDTVVLNNSAADNGRLGDGAGIHVLNTGGARVEGNHVSGNDRGIFVFGTVNLIVRNTATGNTTNFDVAEGNLMGSLAADPGAAGPWDNIAY